MSKQLSQPAQTFGAVLAAVAVISASGSTASAQYIKQLPIAHINSGDYPQAPDSAAVASWMSLKYLGNGSDAYISTTVVPGEVIYNYGRSQQPIGPFEPATTAQTMSHFAITPEYSYEVFTGPTFDGVVREMVKWFNNTIISPPYPQNAPVLFSVGGGFEQWVVMTGFVSDANPVDQPGTPIRGLWFDDPALYNDPMMPIETNVFYSTESGVANNLQSVFLPVASGPYEGLYVAVIPTIPGPPSLAAALVAVCAVRRRRR